MRPFSRECESSARPGPDVQLFAKVIELNSHAEVTGLNETIVSHIVSPYTLSIAIGEIEGLNRI